MADYDSNKQIHTLELYDTTLTKNSLVLSQDSVGNRLGASRFGDLLNTITLDDISDGIEHQRFTQAEIVTIVENTVDDAILASIDTAVDEATAAATEAVLQNPYLATKSGKLTQFASTSSSEFASVITDETGSGSLVFNISPTFVTPNIGVATGVSFNGITGLSSSAPLVNGVAASGVGNTVSRADHVHPSDPGKANLNSPSFTGVPTAPTAAPATNTTQLATTAFVTNSPIFIGTPSAPTAPQGSNTTQLATTAFVTNYSVSQTSETGSANIPTGTTAQRDGSPVIGYFRFNTSINDFEGYKSTLGWSSLSRAMPPIGSIIPFIGGYFVNGANDGFQPVYGNDVNSINALLNSSGWYVCNGAAVNVAASTIFNAAGRYLPNLTDSRFILGYSYAGVTGGADAINFSHAHNTGSFTLTINEMPSHNHELLYHTSDAYGVIGNQGNAAFPAYFYPTTYTGGGQAHNHGDTSWNLGWTDNKPLFLSCVYIIRVF